MKSNPDMDTPPHHILIILEGIPLYIDRMVEIREWQHLPKYMKILLILQVCHIMMEKVFFQRNSEINLILIKELSPLLVK